ncbi:MAG: hypothetical protein WA959_20185 [Rivularia sp. (in: cyanobacteria)]
MVIFFEPFEYFTALILRGSQNVVGASRSEIVASYHEGARRSNYKCFNPLYSSLQMNEVQPFILKLLWDGHPCPSECTLEK